MKINRRTVTKRHDISSVRGRSDLDFVEALVKVFFVVLDNLHADMHACVCIDALEGCAENSLPNAILYLRDELHRQKGDRLNILT